MTTYMDPVLFKAAEAGDIDPFENYQTCLNQLLTPDENTILHVYLGNQSSKPESTDFVVIILEMCPPLLFQANKKGEIPLHFAARFGHSNVVRVLIDRAKARHTDPESGVTEAKKMLRMTNEEQDTALHEAARSIQAQVVEILTKEDPEFSYSANVHGETPLYIAAASRGSYIGLWTEERGKVVDEILGNSISVDYGGPNGRTALHAASRVGDDGTARKLLEKEKKLTKTTDENDWSPLHYAAYYGWSGTVEVLLEYDASAAYIAETEKKRTALHLAAIQGLVDVMKDIVSRCPACCELVDNRGWNALHYAVARIGRLGTTSICKEDIVVFDECLKIPELARLGTKKDDKGNTPFHLIAALAHKQKQWRLVLFVSEIPELCGLNKRKLSIYDIDEENFGEIQKEILESLGDVGSGPIGHGPFVLKKINNDEENKKEEEAFSKARESHLVVAALIATVTFAAAFTLPGGYKSDRGTAILAKNINFIVFIISDTMSLVLSSFAVFIHFLISFTQGIGGGKYEVIKKDTTRRLFWVAMALTIFGMCTMMTAFVSGICAVLESSPGLGFITFLIGYSFYFLMCLGFWFVIQDVKDKT
ncbi:protein ACCELERATED CELL DEATH 6-like [Populus alba x Populus x berolinensis]|nr:protein ACCELERATED CELL DEATH 6-like [Populus alba x Populus x berolinensis]